MHFRIDRHSLGWLARLPFDSHGINEAEGCLMNAEVSISGGQPCARCNIQLTDAAILSYRVGCCIIIGQSHSCHRWAARKVFVTVAMKVTLCREVTAEHWLSGMSHNDASQLQSSGEKRTSIPRESEIQLTAKVTLKAKSCGQLSIVFHIMNGWHMA